MKQILLLRHAKSSWSQGDLSDFERPLAERGLKDAPKMGGFLKETGNTPDQIISSTAQRAKETTKLALDGMEKDQDIISWNQDLYYGGIGDYLKAIQSAHSKVERVILVGHNPKIENTAGALMGSNAVANVRMPTAALVCLNTYVKDWQQVSWGSCQLAWMMIPKVLKHIYD
ncbi:MAG: histidine phosphatase family protein [Balneola sp.]